MVYDTSEAIKNLSQKMQEFNLNEMQNKKNNFQREVLCEYISQVNFIFVFYTFLIKIQFIQLWKTFYDVVGNQSTNDEMQLFHSLAVAGFFLNIKFKNNLKF